MSHLHRLTVVNYVTVKELVTIVDYAIPDHDQMVEFVMALDEEVADLGFTVALRDRLNAVIAEETT